MADLFLGQTCTHLIHFISAGTAHTFDLPWQADKAVFVNLTKWAATAGNLPLSIWYRNYTTAAKAYQQKVIDSAAAQSFNFQLAAADGFTVADTSGGVASSQLDINAISKADPCVVETTTAHGWQTNQIVRFTDLGSDMPTARGMDQLNNNRYRIVVLTSTTFSLKDVITGEPIDSLNYTTYVSGGYVTLETHVLTLNNPQVSPYSASNPYNPNQFSYDPINYKLTAGTAVMGADNDEFLIELYKFGSFEDLGDLVT